MLILRLSGLLLCAFVSFSQQLECSQIATNDQVAGRILKIPNNADNPVNMTPNFNCTYTIRPPGMVSAQIRVTNVLNGVDDVISVTDGLAHKTVINRNSDSSVVFYVFPQTETNVNVVGGNGNTSSFLLTITYSSLPTATQKQLQKDQNLNYFLLNSLQNQPITVSSDEKITVTVARSGHITDVFDNYFVVDGDFSSSKSSVNRLVDFETVNFVSTGNSLTIVGLDNATSYASVIFTPTSATAGYSKFAGITVAAGQTSTVSVKASDGQKAAVIVVAKDQRQLVLDRLEFPASDSCTVSSGTGSPNSYSKKLIDFSSDPYSLPQLFPYPYFSIIVENCDAQFHLTTDTPSNYYNISQEKAGFIFSPSYFNLNENADFNVTFVYTGDDSKQFVVDVDGVTVNSNGKLDIDIYDSEWRKTLSTVITGNQEGTRSKASGSYLNVQMSGNGTARLIYQLTSSSFSRFGVPALALTISFMVLTRIQ
ncbi:unnamed protein product [Caenorhabditis sp. 36 PRJEB53466]|nr:unnamed protein product [Caenorhabditis sp. 36 PRJEB53466]